MWANQLPFGIIIYFFNVTIDFSFPFDQLIKFFPYVLQ